MGFDSHIDEFGGKPVREYDPGQGLPDPAGVAHRLRLDWDMAEGGATIGGSFTADAPRRKAGPVIIPPSKGLLTKLFGGERPPQQPPLPPADDPDDLLARFLSEPEAKKVTSLIIGAWEEPYERSSAGAVAGLVARRDRLPSLRHLFIGEMVMEENEVSWIKQSDLSPLWAAFPDLELLRVRGNDGLSLGRLAHHNLRSLIIESGGLSQTVVRQVADAELPALEHLELWLGTDEYGGDHTVQDLFPILNGQQFPRLKYLGLRNSALADEVAAAIAKAPITGRIDVLDLSMGNLSNAGAEKLAQSGALRRLKLLDIHHHYVSETVLDHLRAVGMPLDASDRQEADDYGHGPDRYIAVSE